MPQDTELTKDITDIRSLIQRMDGSHTENEKDGIEAVLNAENESQNGQYQINDDETMYYYDIPKEFIGGNAQIYVDGHQAYKKFNHPLWVIVLNSYDKLPRESDRFALSVEDNPRVLVPVENNKILLNSQDLLRVKRFIQTYKDEIIKFGAGEIHSMDFYDDLERKIMPYAIAESKDLITEQPALDTYITGLKTDIWVDNQARQLNHNPYRLKFYVSQNDNRTASIVLTDPVDVIEKHLHGVPKSITKREINRVVEFARKYKDLFIAQLDNAVGFRQVEQIIYAIEHGRPLTYDLQKIAEKYNCFPK